MSYTTDYLAEASWILKALDAEAIDRIVQLLCDLRERGGRLFCLGIGGGAANASHAVNDFRKITGIEAYAATDNVSELTARVNDDGWESVFVEWLKGSRLKAGDMLFVLSVGGGDLERNVSANLVRALQHAQEVGARVCGVVGRASGYTARVADACVIVPTANPKTITPHTESFQALVWHLLVSHPRLQVSAMKWESLGRGMRKAVFLDRDGVLNRAVVRDGRPYPPASPAEVEILPGVAEACATLHEAGFLLIAVTNQPDVARGAQRRETVEAINRALQARLPLDDVRVCYHDDGDHCACRKPQPGLLLQAARDWDIDLPGSFVVGDRWKDIQAGRRAGCQAIWVDNGYTEGEPDNPDCRVRSLVEAADWILRCHAWNAQKGKEGVDEKPV
jgi:D-sedoheptulose 7-phosphate isomerase